MIKRNGFILADKVVSLIVILVISSTCILSVVSFSNMIDKFNHKNFKMEFMNFINMGKHKASLEEEIYKLRFQENQIDLLNKSNKVVDRFRFKETIKMIKFNGVNNRTLTINNDGSITRGATFIYSFKDEINQITISTITGKINYE